MHGRVKTRSTQEQQEIKNKERQKKLALYRAGMELAFEKRRNGEYDDSGLEVTSQLLSANPDIYTLWNFRREILLDLKVKRSPEDFQSLMESELQLTQRCLQNNPKSYGGWHHRVWVLDNMPEPNFKQELSLCDKYLSMDERNFHVWDHRRIVVSKSQVTSADELAFTAEKIAVNFSNYSSWHYRSRLLPQVYPDPRGRRPIREEKHKEELELVQNACFTDPDDTSAWFYQRWLLGRSLPALGFSHVLVSCDCISVTFTRKTRLLLEDLHVACLLDGEHLQGVWASTCGGDVAHTWGFYPNTELPSGANVVVVNMYQDSRDLDSMTLQVTDGQGFGLRRSQFEAGFSQDLTTVLEEELANCLQLLQMEPDSKWTLLTSVLLMQAIDRQKYKEETMAQLDHLLKVDPLRTGYYKDLRSRLVMEYAINALEERRSDKEIDLSGQQLTSLYHGHHLGYLLKMDLRQNRLFRSLGQLHHLHSCAWLCLDDNDIESLDALPDLPALRSLSLRGNNIQRIADVQNVERCPNIQVLDLTGNPVEHHYLLQSTLREILSDIKILNDRVL